MNSKHLLTVAAFALAFYFVGVFFPAPGQMVASKVTGLVG